MLEVREDGIYSISGRDWFIGHVSHTGHARCTRSDGLVQWLSVVHIQSNVDKIIFQPSKAREDVYKLRADYGNTAK